MNKKKIIFLLMVLIGLIGVSYAWFNYYQEGTNKKVLSSNLYLYLDDDTNNVLLQNVYPLSIEEARARNDNTIDFSIEGLNTSSDNIHYEIRLVYGDEDNNLERLDDEDLVFDLIEIDSNNNETYLLDAVSFPSIDERKIWIDSVLKNTSSEVSKTYKLRVWVSDSILISDTDPNRDYTAHSGVKDFKDRYASVKVAVYGDLQEKSLPASTITRDSYVENGKSYFRVNLSNDYLLEEEGELLDQNDTVRIVITNPENKLDFTYKDSEGNEVETKAGSLDVTYTYNRNKTITMQVFTESKNDTNVKTELNFKVYKNGTLVQEYNKKINVVGNNYCLNNGFTKLTDCILVSENLSRSTNEAKTYINSKGAPNVNVTAPTYTYVEEQTENSEYTGYPGYPDWRLSDKYVFDSTTGAFTLKKADGVTNETSTAALSNDAIGKYTAGTTNNSYTGVSTIYKITSVDTANNKITGTKITYKITSSMDSQVGLYKVADDYGDSYIFRGDVKNNNVYFGGYYWKIIRINGSDANHDGSIRLIFNGATLSADGNKTAGNNAAIANNANGYGTTYSFNPSPGGPTYVGYMNTESENYWTTTTLTTYSNFAEDTEYYFADSFETYTDGADRQFKLKENTFLKKKKLKDLTTDELNKTLYTCSETNANLICSRLVKIDSRVANSNTQVRGHYITYSPDYISNPSLTKADVETNARDSNAKTQLETWYVNKLSNKTNNGNPVTDYIIDGTFCNDRSIYNPYANGSYTLQNSYNSGYLLTTHTYYAARTRLLDAAVPNKSAILTCPNANDKFSTTSTYGNAKLTYPIALITVDEVALAGGKYNEKNENFYLRTNGYFWTMSPSYFSSTYAVAVEWNVYPTGLLNSNIVSSGFGLRAVINLNSNTRISEGDGTVSNPYIIE